MSLSAAQYADMRLRLRIIIAGGYGNASMSDGELNSFVAQLLSDAGSLGSITAAKQSQGDVYCLGILSGILASPGLADIATFWTNAATDSSGASALSATRYQYLRTELATRLTLSFDNAARYVAAYGNFALSQVGTRATFPTGSFATTTPWMVRSIHRMRCGAGRSLGAIQFAYANAFGTAGEQGSGGTITIKASAEYPIGAANRQPVLYSGASSLVMPNNTAPLCDLQNLSTPIPDGALFAINALLTPSVAIVFCGSYAKNVAFGDAVVFGGTDQTGPGSGAILDNTTSAILPCSILGLTTARTVVILGDSRQAGLGDQADSVSGDVGEIARALGGLYAYANLGVPSETAGQYNASHALRAAIAATCTDAIVGYPINDMFFGASAATAEAAMVTLKNALANRKKSRITVPPISTGAWTAVDGSDQTTDASNGARNTYNTGVTANAAGWDGVIDMCTDVELAPLGTGKWQADGTAHKYTADGIHETKFANQKRTTISLP